MRTALGCMWCVGFTDLVVYRIIGGVGIGIVSIVSPVYISEISPQKVRGTMVALYQLAITAGFVRAYLVNEGQGTDPGRGEEQEGVSKIFAALSVLGLGTRVVCDAAPQCVRFSVAGAKRVRVSGMVGEDIL